MTVTRPHPPLIEFTDLTIISTPVDIETLIAIARYAGLLVSRSAPQPAGRDDPRVRVSIRLQLRN